MHALTRTEDSPPDSMSRAPAIMWPPIVLLPISEENAAAHNPTANSPEAQPPIVGSRIAAIVAGALDMESGGLSSVRVKACITVVMVIGGVVAVAFGGIPVQLIVTAQAVTIFVVPLVGIVLVALARHPDRGRLRLGVAQTVLACAGVAFLLVLALTYLGNLL
jgi:hypothetical protein